MIKLFNYLLISSIFTGGFVFNNGHFDFYLSYIFMAGFLLACVFFYRKIDIPRKFLYILTAVFFLSLINVFQGNNSLPALLKVMIGFLLNGVTYYLLIRLNDNKVDGLFRIYIQIACAVALIGIFQEISYLVGFKGGYDYRFFIPRTVRPSTQYGILRVISIMQEPAHLGAAMAPALFVSILNIIQGTKYFINKKMSWLIIACVLLSFSLVSYLGIIAVFVLIMFNYKRVKMIVVCTLIPVILIFTAYKTLPEIRLRIDDTIAVISGKKPLDRHVTLSVFVVCRNGFVAYQSFRNNPLFGSGLGSHPLSYGRYISPETDPEIIMPTLNKEDASGLFLRILSETGLLGVFLFFYFIFRFYVSRKKQSHFWVISNAIICLVILNLLRQGNYFYNGFIFFIWLYYFTYKNAEAKETPV
ncbi:MAG: hypothetical protein NTX01_05680 [Candidatus Omnitrophica bacterium]|nr:hypothetical protein [Candidatus Omnitrophota bacterium]